MLPRELALVSAIALVACETGAPVCSDAGSPSTQQVVGGIAHTCAIRDGEVFCWGYGDQGELGNGDDYSESMPVRVLGISGARQLAAGWYHTCAVRCDGRVLCWGERFDSGEDLRAASVSGVSDAVGVAAGIFHSCALLRTGGIACWGANTYGSLGDGSASTHASALPVVGVTEAVDLTSGDNHVLARRADGSWIAWGDNQFQQLADGSTAFSRATPVPARSLTTPLAAAGGDMTCSSSSSGELTCVGVGHGYGGARLPSPPAVADPGGIVQLAVGGAFACGLRASGGVVCWGDNSEGQLGGGPSIGLSEVVGLTDATSIGAGLAHACAQRVTGEVVCWGAGEHGQLGDGSWTSSPTPVLALVSH